MTRRFFVPEIVQTSEMDCGPATLKALLEGYGISASYGRLREACQTQVDGTSIDVIEQVAIQLGLDAEQIMIPTDHLLLPEANVLPALVVVRLPNGLAHFVIIWSRHGHFLQVMDPGVGRRWVDEKRLLAELYVHRFPVPAQAFRDWAGTEGFLAPLRRRLSDLGLTGQQTADLVTQAAGDAGWRGWATLDAATRMVSAIVRASGIQRGEMAARLVLRFMESAGADGTKRSLPIPAPFWFVEPVSRDVAAPDAKEQVLLRGAVLIRVRGTILPSPETLGENKLPPELAAALREPALDPERELWRVLRQDGLPTLGVLGVALFVAAVGVTAEAFLLQGVMKLASGPSTLDLRGMAFAIVSALVLFLWVLEFPLAIAELRIGRRLETRLRILYLSKIPRLADRYLHSRLTSDMTMRAHGLRSLRSLPTLATSSLRLVFQFVLTAMGVVLLDPLSAPWALAFALVCGASTYAGGMIQREREMRLHMHNGASSRFFLDALLGLVPVRTHGAERSLRREHERLLTEWTRSSLDTWRMLVTLQGVGAVVYAAFSVVILLGYVERGGQTHDMLLLFYWTLNLPALAQSLFVRLEQYPVVRNRVLCLLEPLSAPDESAIVEPTDTLPVTAVPEVSAVAPSDDGLGLPGAGIEFHHVTVQAGGHTVLSDINLDIHPGEHVAILGPSGAGKSSLVGVLLGWHKPTEGLVTVDRTPLDGTRLRGLRRETAWIDPAVQLWNQSLLSNLQYGRGIGDHSSGETLAQADLLATVERLPEGMQTALGENGGLVAGGEGQRVRLARALNQRGVRLAILDEPFRGLDRATRRMLLARARAHWGGATLLCITHDVGETQGFPRVLVMENGRIVQDGAPAVLAAQLDSRYGAMLEAEKQVREGLWEGKAWRRLWMEEGELSEIRASEEPGRTVIAGSR